jgi:hypothetical protein
MALNPAFQPLLEAVKYVMYEPGGIFIIAAATEDNQTAEQITFAPPSSGKLYRAAENKAELINLGLVGNGMLRRKITPDSEKWLVDHGWAKPQEPFNPHYSMTNRGDLTLDELLEFALESWVIAYGVTPNTPFGMHLALFQQEEIAAKYLTLDTETYLFTIPGFEPNVRFEPAPPKKPRKKAAKTESNKPETSKPEKASPKSTKPSIYRDFSIGDRVFFNVSSGNKVITIEGEIVGGAGAKARIRVEGNPEVPDNTYSFPWEALKKLL